ncbi:MAG TPA: hypothetical protein VEK15_18500 [Vicinamibacteria bacterium]|nr:hypothetical protein [Vicinamibacteria bacterium]
MDSENALAFLALVWLVGGLILMGRSIRQGRALADALAARHPETYEALGRPRPGYFHSVRRDQFARFLARREFRNLGDPLLEVQFEEHRQAEARLLLLLLSTLGGIALLLFISRHAG